jgi:hypothetical protein
MAQTDTRTGFRLPWTAERGEGEPPADGDGSDTQETETPDMIDTTQTSEPADTAATSDPGEADHAAPVAELAALQAAGAGLPPRRASKFMADLSRAMQTAAETARDETMLRFEAETKSAIEEIQSASGDEAAALRRRADDDVAAVREWSKAEIARIREETEARIALRKTALDGEMDQHGLVVESRVQQVGATVAAFEQEMAAFFERLSTEQDPTRIAGMAERMPEPPDLAGVAASIVEPMTASFAPAETLIDDAPAVEGDGGEMTDSEASAESGETAEISDGSETEIGDAETVEADEGETETEVSAPDFAAAEAEAAAFTGDVEDDASEASEPTPAPTHDHESAAAALAATADDSPPQGERATTRVMVTGLVSVASIATFKRSLGRVPGVSTIGVASGPDGEFVFTVSHDAGIGLGEAIVALPGFEARVTAETSGGLEVAAHDPDAGS